MHANPSVYPLEFDRAGFLLLTADQWRGLHKDYKGMISGRKTAMVYIPNQGTGLVFVKIVRSRSNPSKKYDVLSDDVLADLRPHRITRAICTRCSTEFSIKNRDKDDCELCNDCRDAEQYQDTDERTNPMAKKKRRSTPRMKDVLGRITLPSKSYRPSRRRKARRSTKTLHYGKPAARSSGTSPKRILTILGVGAAAIWLTHRVTGTRPLTPAQMAQPKILSAPADTAVRPASGPTLPDGTAV